MKYNKACHAQQFITCHSSRSSSRSSSSHKELRQQLILPQCILVSFSVFGQRFVAVFTFVLNYIIQSETRVAKNLTRSSATSLPQGLQHLRVAVVAVAAVAFRAHILMLLLLSLCPMPHWLCAALALRRLAYSSIFVRMQFTQRRKELLPATAATSSSNSRIRKTLSTVSDQKKCINIFVLAWDGRDAVALQPVNCKFSEMFLFLFLFLFCFFSFISALAQARTIDCSGDRRRGPGQGQIGHSPRHWGCHWGIASLNGRRIFGIRYAHFVHVLVCVYFMGSFPPLSLSLFFSISFSRSPSSSCSRFLLLFDMTQAVRARRQCLDSLCNKSADPVP